LVHCDIDHLMKPAGNAAQDAARNGPTGQGGRRLAAGCGIGRPFNLRRPSIMVN
jgi:hypothetical protein